MIPANDVYVDKNDNVTTDPKEYAVQIASRGCHLDDRIARRYGIVDALVSPMEPDARRMVIGKWGRKPPTNVPSKPEPEPAKSIADAPATEPEADEAATEQPAEKAEAKKGAKKK